MSSYILDKNSEEINFVEFSSGTISGSGTANFVSKFNGATTITDSSIFDDGSQIGIFNSTPSSKLHFNNTTPLGTTTIGTGLSYPVSTFFIDEDSTPAVTSVGHGYQYQYLNDGSVIYSFLSSTYFEGNNNIIRGNGSLIEFDGTGTGNAIQAFHSTITLTASGQLDSVAIITYSYNNSGPTTVDNFYGFYHDDATITGTNPTNLWPIYIDSTFPSYISNFLGIGNDAAVENLHLIDGYTMAIKMATVTGETASQTTGGTYTAGNDIRYQIVAVDHRGEETPLSTEIGGVLSGLNTAWEIEWNIVPGADYYKIYRNYLLGGYNDYIEVLEETGPTITIVDDGTLIYNAGTPSSTNANSFFINIDGTSDGSYVGSDFYIRETLYVAQAIIKDNPVVTNSDLIIVPQGTGGIKTSTSSNQIGEYAVDLQISRSANTQIAAADYSGLFAGTDNTIGTTSGASIIIGGNSNEISNTSIISTIIGSNTCTIGPSTPIATCNFIAGSENCTITGGAVSVPGYNAIICGKDNTVTSCEHTLLTGFNNTLTNVQFSAIFGRNNVVANTTPTPLGYNLLISGDSHTLNDCQYVNVFGDSHTSTEGHYSLISGESCENNGIYNLVFGYYGYSNLRGQLIHANSNTNTVGQAQWSQTILTAETISTGTSSLTTDGGAASATNQLPIRLNTTYALEIHIIGKDLTDTSKKGYFVRRFIISNDGGTSTLFTAGIDNTFDMSNFTTVTISISVNNTDDVLEIEVTGEDSDTVSWNAVIHAVEVL